MLKNKKISYSLTLIPLVIIFGLFIWLFTVIFEGEKPQITLDPLPEFLSKSQNFTLQISDRKRGLKTLKVSYDQGGRDVIIFEKRFPFKGLFNKEGLRSFKKEIEVNPTALHLAQGRVDLNVSVRDYSRRGGGDGNLGIIKHKMTVDTIPPSIRALSRMHNINLGGSGLVVYRASSDTEESGVYVNNNFFRGFPAGEKQEEGLHLAYFAVPHDSNLDPSIYLWAKDKAENTTNATFYYHVRRKRFSNSKLNISDKFLSRVLPYFSFYDLSQEETNIDKYIKINNDLRKEDNDTFYNLMQNTDLSQIWEGTWTRLKNAATMAKYADKRGYYYKGEKIDEQTHLGIDLASLANSPVTAANNGIITFAERNGIYGLTVMIDHGQGLASLYGHMSSIEATAGQEVKKGDVIGHTGQTGLAGGDHLHFSILVGGVFVEPIEWWDSHWIEDNIYKKLELIKQKKK
ncbi:M23 family metallopeptidase [Thermodesulfobacteriota bacterium]